jgi:D-alanyl-D-alanine endopeptidase (penicillin-binding protein 7)
MSPVVFGARVRRFVLMLSGLLLLQAPIQAIATDRPAKPGAKKEQRASKARPKADAPARRTVYTPPPARKGARPSGRDMMVEGRKAGGAAKAQARAASNARAAVAARNATKQRGGRVVKASFAPRAVEPPRLSIGQAIGLHMTDDPLDLRSSVAMVLDQRSGEALYEKNPEAVLPIASITKVMTAMVVLDAGLPMDEMIEITEADRDTERHSSSRLPIRSRLSRAELMQLSLMSSENRAAHALGRAYPGGIDAFVAAMNAKARAIGMVDSRFSDPTGLSSGNVSNARDLARMVRAAHGYPLIRDYSTATDLTVDLGYRQATFRSTNRLIVDPNWDIGLQKTGYISEAGKCLVLQAKVDGRPVIIVLLDATATQWRFADAQRLRKWLEQQPRGEAPVAETPRS